MKIFHLLALIICAPLVNANNDSRYFNIDLKLLDAPYDITTRYNTLSMQQSLTTTKSFYYATHYGIEQGSIKWLGKNGKLWSRFIITVFDFAPLPFSNTWMHEEWHRSVLALHGYSSQNTFWANSVTRLNDDDLIQLKELHPADMVREATAGNEGNLEFVFSLEKDHFFGEANMWNYSLYWGNYVVNSFYLYGSTRDSPALVRYKNGQDATIAHRDANGFDPVNAVYDMFNPHESYEQRGQHPSGAGIDRYVEYSDLSPEAKTHIKTQFYLSLLNFVDPNLIGFSEFGKNLKWNLTLRHHFIPFGYMTGANVFLKNKNWGLILSPQIYRNKIKTSAGLSLELRYKWLQFHLAGWDQPSNLSYYDTNHQLGGRIGLLAKIPISGSIYPYLEAHYKTNGWIAGNPYLSKQGNLAFGVQWYPFKRQ